MADVGPRTFGSELSRAPGKKQAREENKLGDARPDHNDFIVDIATARMWKRFDDIFRGSGKAKANGFRRV